MKKQIMKKLNDSWKNAKISDSGITDEIVNDIKGRLYKKYPELDELINEYFNSKLENVKELIFNENIWDFLNEIAPENCHFCANCDFGFWDEKLLKSLNDKK